MSILNWLKKHLGFGETIINNDLSEKIQGGLIVEKPSESDWFVKAVPEVKEKVQWVSYLPKGESQNVKFVFDTLSCTTFSALNIIETLFKKMDIPPEHKLFLERNGYYKDGEVNFSDKFTAIVSGTTKQGNTFQNVGNSIRHNGLIPDSILPFGNETKWEDWHNPNQIQAYMISLGQEFARYFDVTYSFVYFNDDGKMKPEHKILIEENLYNAPLNVAIPYPATHATVLYEVYDNGYMLYDTYDPYIFTKKFDTNIHYVATYSVTPKKVTTLNRTLKLGDRGEDVKKMQRTLAFLTDMGVYPDGIFGKKTEEALKNYQKLVNLLPDGVFGKETRAKLYSYDMENPIAIIERGVSGKKQVLGDMKCYTAGATKYMKTLELPWLDNKKNVSCIPKGTYEVKWTYSGTFKRYTYEIMNVPGRTGIRFHSANHYTDLKGCIACGYEYADINKDGTTDIIESKKAIKDLEDFFGKKPFALHIV